MNLHRTVATLKAALWWPAVVVLALALVFCAQPAPAAQPAQPKSQPYTYVDCDSTVRAAMAILLIAKRATTDTEVEALERLIADARKTKGGALAVNLAAAARKSGDPAAYLRGWLLACYLEQA